MNTQLYQHHDTARCQSMLLLDNAARATIDILIDYFSNSNDENDLRLDKKGCLVYKNLATNTKFAVYVDYFLKYPVQSKSRPLYFDELFLDKISKSQTKFDPTIRHESSRTAKRRKTRNKKNESSKRYGGTRTNYKL